MDRELAKKLLPFVNDQTVQIELGVYINHRIQFHRDQLEISDNAESRGAIKELRRFLTLRDEVYSHKDG